MGLKLLNYSEPTKATRPQSKKFTLTLDNESDSTNLNYTLDNDLCRFPN